MHPLIKTNTHPAIYPLPLLDDVKGVPVATDVMTSSSLSQIANSHHMVDSNGQVFHRFSHLPTELRLAIWRECLPRRVVEIDPHYDEDDDVPSPCKWEHTTTLNRRLPVISRVCHESRMVACEAGHYRDLKAPPDAEWKSALRLNHSWIDSSRDTVHLHWIPFFEPLFSYCTNGGSALDYLAWNASQAQGGSFMFNYLESNFDGDVDMEERIGALQKLRRGAVVMRIIVVHTTIENAAKAELFGLLGDAPIQIVDASDTQRLDALFDLAEACESTRNFTATRQDFQKDSPELYKTTLKKKLVDAFQSQGAQMLSSLYPAIMFRLCPNFCNRPFKGSKQAEVEANDTSQNTRKPHVRGHENFRSFIESMIVR